MRNTLCLRRTYSLLELLIVIAIIAILALLTTWTLRAFRRTGGNRGAFELSQLAEAIEVYRQNYGEYPPDFTSNAATAQHMDQCYHRYKGGLPAYMDVSQEQHLDPSEALVFWLGTLNNDLLNPFPSAAATPAAIQANNRSLFDFKPDQLRDSTATAGSRIAPPGASHQRPTCISAHGPTPAPFGHIRRAAA